LKDKCPYVSVIIPVLDDTDRLKICLEALSFQYWPSDRMEIIVVDNGSEKSPSSLIKNFGAKYIEEKTPGSYSARNKGILMARGDILAFTDADCIPDPNWIAEGVRMLTGLPDIGLIGGAIRVFIDNHSSRAYQIYDQLNHFDQKRFVEKFHFAATANAFTKKSIIREVGLFETKFKSFGDIEWGNRVAKNGYSVVFNTDCVVQHPAASSLKRLVGRSRRLMGGNIRMRRWKGFDRWVDIPLLLQNWLGMPIFIIKRAIDPRLKGFRQRLMFVIISTFVHIIKCIEEVRLFFYPDTEIR
jgi:cellulose synthase/poly-beta-1,6-N-acetylglucosamine synthase-like glycosyltransferase